MIKCVQFLGVMGVSVVLGGIHKLDACKTLQRGGLLKNVLHMINVQQQLEALYTLKDLVTRVEKPRW